MDDTGRDPHDAYRQALAQAIKHLGLRESVFAEHTWAAMVKNSPHSLHLMASLFSLLYEDENSYAIFQEVIEVMDELNLLDDVLALPSFRKDTMSEDPRNIIGSSNPYELLFFVRDVPTDSSHEAWVDTFYKMLHSTVGEACVRVFQRVPATMAQLFLALAKHKIPLKKISEVFFNKKELAWVIAQSKRTDLPPDVEKKSKRDITHKGVELRHEAKKHQDRASQN